MTGLYDDFTPIGERVTAMEAEIDRLKGERVGMVLVPGDVVERILEAHQQSTVDWPAMALLKQAEQQGKG